MRQERTKVVGLHALVHLQEHTQRRVLSGTSGVHERKKARHQMARRGEGVCTTVMKTPREARMETSNDVRNSTSKSVMQTLFRLRIDTKAEKKERTREYRHENMSGNKRT